MATQTAGKVLVVYYSRTGNTARVARDLARLTRADVEILRDPDHGGGFAGWLRTSIDLFRDRPVDLGELRFDPADYALTIIGTPVWAGKMTPAVRTWLRRFASRLQHVGLFVTSANTRASKIVLPVERILGRQTDAFIGFQATDLADQQFYDDKVATFLKALRPSLPLLPMSSAVGL